MKKRLACVLILFTIVFSLFPTALAADTITYDLSPLDISVELPANWAVVTAPDFDEETCRKYFDLSAGEMERKFQDYNLYLNSVDMNSKDDGIYIYAYETSDTNYNELSNEELDAKADAYIRYYSDAEIFTQHSIYEYSNIKFIVVDSYQSNDHHYKKYFTVHDGYEIFYIAESFNGAVEGEHAEALKGAVDSTIFADDNPMFTFKTAAIAVIANAAVASIVYLIVRSRRRKKADAKSTGAITPKNTYYNAQPIHAGPILSQTAPAQPIYTQPVPIQEVSVQTAAVQPFPAQTPPAQSSGLPYNENAARLKQLKALFDSGLITEAEYSAKKAEILKNF